MVAGAITDDTRGREVRQCYRLVWIDDPTVPVGGRCRGQISPVIHGKKHYEGDRGPMVGATEAVVPPSMGPVTILLLISRQETGATPVDRGRVSATTGA